MFVIKPILRERKEDQEYDEVSRYALVERKPRTEGVLMVHENIGQVRRFCQKWGIKPMELEPGEEL